MTQRFYFDTSVFGGAFDIEFDAPTLQLFEKVKIGEIICIYSDLTVGELDNAPRRVRDYFNDLPKEHLEFVRMTDESLDLAKIYVAEKVVGPTSFDDCVHIDLATIHKADILVSWNFKHIVNVYRIRGYNSVNLKSGYTAIEIRSPKDIVGYENDETN